MLVPFFFWRTASTAGQFNPRVSGRITSSEFSGLQGDNGRFDVADNPEFPSHKSKQIRKLGTHRHNFHDRSAMSGDYDGFAFGLNLVQDFQAA